MISCLVLLCVKCHSAGSDSSFLIDSSVVSWCWCTARPLLTRGLRGSNKRACGLCHGFVRFLFCFSHRRKWCLAFASLHVGRGSIFERTCTLQRFQASVGWCVVFSPSYHCSSWIEPRPRHGYFSFYYCLFLCSSPSLFIIVCFYAHRHETYDLRVLSCVNPGVHTSLISRTILRDWVKSEDKLQLPVIISKEQSPFWEGEVVKKLPSFYETRRFITVFTRARHWTLSLARWIHSTSWPYFITMQC